VLRNVQTGYGTLLVSYSTGIGTSSLG